MSISEPTNHDVNRRRVIDQDRNIASPVPEDIPIGHRTIGGRNRPLVIAEVGLEHSGKLERALAFIKVVAKMGGDAIKFQTHIAAAESTPEEGFRGDGSQKESRADYWVRTAFNSESWEELSRCCKEHGLIFLSSPFSTAAVDLLDSIGMEAWKVPSGEFRSLQLMEAIAKTGKPVLLSTGMSTWAEIDYAMDLFTKAGQKVVCLQSTSKYPTQMNEVGLNAMSQMANRYHCHVGLSDHSGNPWAAIAAIALGARVIEVHLDMGTSQTPDSNVLISHRDFSLIVELAAVIDELLVPVDKNTMAGDLVSERETYAKSLALRLGGKKGTYLTLDHLTERKPGRGIDPRNATELVGRVLRHDIPPKQLLTWSDLDG